MSSLIEYLPDFVQNIEFWGGTAYRLQTLHAHGDGLEYWACFSVISIGIRTLLIPAVWYGAETASRFGKVVAEIQFIVTLYQADLKMLREAAMQNPHRSFFKEKMFLFRTNMKSIGQVYKIHKIHPLAVFISPLLQIMALTYMECY